MKAVVFTGFGGPEVLSYQDVETPKVGPDDVLIEVGAVSVNRTFDIFMREDKYAHTPDIPHVPGVDPSGVIVEVGENVTDRKVGDRVFCSLFIPTTNPKAFLTLPGLGLVDFLGVTVWGGYAQYVRTMASRTVPIPDNMNFHTATVIGRHLATASNQVDGVLQAGEGDQVLVMGATGGLGAACVQTLKWNGAEVIAAAGTDERVAATLDIGADHAINYRTQDLTAEVMKITNGKGVMGVCDSVADPELFPKVIMSMGREAKLVTAGNASGSTDVPLDIRRLYLFQLQIIGEPREAPGGLEKAFSRAGESDVKVLIDKVYPLSQAADAQRRVESRDGTGKVVIDPTLG
ncbi:MAG: zinc-binding dehydrogenase [Alphaproteobacteria bacterium]|nr:zinc-binding dehydrogenase [Alphaproteobacteria bacterium]